MKTLVSKPNRLFVVKEKWNLTKTDVWFVFTDTFESEHFFNEKNSNRYIYIPLVCSLVAKLSTTDWERSWKRNIWRVLNKETQIKDLGTFDAGPTTISWYMVIWVISGLFIEKNHQKNFFVICINCHCTVIHFTIFSARQWLNDGFPNWSIERKGAIEWLSRSPDFSLIDFHYNLLLLLIWTKYSISFSKY